MRIGIDARMYGHKQTGIGLYIQNLVTRLLAQDDGNEYVLFLSPEGASALGEVPERATVVISGCQWYSFCEQIVFLWQILKARVNLMHFPHFNVPILYFKKFVVTIHDVIPLFYPGKKVGKSYFRRASFRLVLRAAVVNSEKIIAVSENTKKDIIEQCGVPAEKITVIYEGIPITPESAPPADRGFLLPPRPYVLYAGVWREHKNLSGLVAAFAMVVNEYGIDAHLAIVGAPDEAYIEPKHIWMREGIKDRVTVYDSLPEGNLAALFGGAFMVAVPSFYEGFGFVGLEAMTFGKPVIASRVASLPEIFGDAARYFDPKSIQDIADAMRDVLSRPEIARSLAEKGRIRAARFNWETMIAETQKEYQKAGNMVK